MTALQRSCSLLCSRQRQRACRVLYAMLGLHVSKFLVGFYWFFFWFEFKAVLECAMNEPMVGMIFYIRHYSGMHDVLLAHQNIINKVPILNWGCIQIVFKLFSIECLWWLVDALWRTLMASTHCHCSYLYHNFKALLSRPQNLGPL